MRTAWVLCIAMLAAPTAHAGECAVEVYTNRDLGPERESLVDRAEEKTTSMFARADVRVEWRVSSARRVPPMHGCEEPIDVHFEVHPLEGDRPGALAYSIPYTQTGVSIHIFLDRITLDRSDSLAAALLAHVLAHEITHVVQRINRHSHAGVMKPVFRPGDLDRMVKWPLPFADEDVVLLHLGLADRQIQTVLLTKTFQGEQK